MGYVEAIRAFEHGRLADAAEGVRTVRDGCEVVVRQLANIYLDTLPPFPGRGSIADAIADRVIDAIDEACQYLLDTIAYLDSLVDWLGGPDALRHAADLLESQVSDPASELSLQMRQTALPGLASWHDEPTSDTYRDVVSSQPDELDRTPGLIGSLREVLRGMADAIEQFYIELTATVTGVVVAVAGIVTAVLEAAGVITIPLAVVSIIAAVVGALGALAGIVGMVVTTSQVNGNLLDTARTAFDRTWANDQQFATVR
jgi:hypothetical protein